MKILVTGSHGFIGSHLVERLLNDGHKVIGLDNFSTGNMRNIPENPNMSVISGDVRDQNIKWFFEGIDIVFHLAALTRPRESFINPEETTDVNVNGTLNVLLRSIEYGVKKFVFVSSASAYGKQDKYPFGEDITLSPQSPYALTKLVGEQYCQLYGQLSDMKINRIRPFNVYGYRQSPDSAYAAAVPKFIDALLNDRKPFITGDGKQFRDFIYVKDVVDLMVKVAESDLKDQAFNAGSGKHCSVNSLYETIAGLMGKTTVPDYIEKVDDPDTLAGIEKAERLLGWRPKYSLVEGLQKTIEETK